jgi:putative ABC transport system permease protein
MRLSALWYLYRRRLRAHALQELLAAIGIAAAVALVLAALVAEGSIAGSTREVVKAVVGPATLQLRARDNNGFPEATLERVEAIRGVAQAAPVLDRSATVRARNGREVTVQLAGTDTSLAILDGLAHTLPLNALEKGAVAISAASAHELGIGNGSGEADVTLKLRGRAFRLRLAAVLGGEAIGALSHALAAVMPLAQMQRLARLEGRVSRILVQPRRGRGVELRRGLEAIAGGRLEVASAEQDVSLVRQALRPSDQASALFAVIGALLGFLFAFNAMLLTAPERRQAIADLRLNGGRRGAIVQMVCFQAGCLALAACVPGLAAGYALSRWVFHQSTGYLAEAFPLSPTTVVHAGPVVIALAVGVAATFLASAVPLLDLRRGRTRDAVLRQPGAGNALAPATQVRLFAGAVALVVVASVLFWKVPTAAILAAAALALATVLALPLVFSGLLWAGRELSERNPRLSSLALALSSLRATTLRSLALAATGAVALFGAVALGGGRSNLIDGIGQFARSYAADAPVWVTEPGDNQAVGNFIAGDAAARIAGVPGVASVRAFQGSFLVLGDRRVWIVARPGDAERSVLANQIVEGGYATTLERLREGGWVAVSRAVAAQQHVRVGGVLSLPTPSGERRLRVAALTTNLAWPPGVVFMNTSDYARAWMSASPSAFAVTGVPGDLLHATRPSDPRSLAARVRAVLGAESGLEVVTARERERKINSLAGEGLGQLGEIATMLLVAAVLAMAAALASAINQRRAALAGLRLSGARPRRLRRILLLEGGVMLGAGCLTGAIAGIYGQVVIDRYLKDVTGFPVASAASAARPLELFALVLGAALLIAAVPGWRASRVPPALALGEE